MKTTCEGCINKRDEVTECGFPDSYCKLGHWVGDDTKGVPLIDDPWENCKDFFPKNPHAVYRLGKFQIIVFERFRWGVAMTCLFMTPAGIFCLFLPGQIGLSIAIFVLIWCIFPRKKFVEILK